jgi:hypothetical protein
VQERVSTFLGSIKQLHSAMTQSQQMLSAAVETHSREKVKLSSEKLAAQSHARLLEERIVQAEKMVAVLRRDNAQLMQVCLAHEFVLATILCTCLDCLNRLLYTRLFFAYVAGCAHNNCGTVRQSQLQPAPLGVCVCLSAAQLMHALARWCLHSEKSFKNVAV